MQSANKTSTDRSTLPASTNKSSRRKLDALALATFHTATFAVAVSSIRKDIAIYGLLAALVVTMDIVYFIDPPKRHPVLDPEPNTADPEPKTKFRTFALEYFVLFAPPLTFVLWLFSLIWGHQTLTRQQLIATVVIMPVIVGLISWIIYIRTTRHHRGIRNSATQLIALSMMGTWIGSTFVFFVLLVCLLSR